MRAGSAFIEACVSGCYLLLSSPHLTLFFFYTSHSLTHFIYVPSWWLSFFLTLILSLRPIFCLITPISSNSRCPNSESVHFNLIVPLDGMMNSRSRFAAGFAHQQCTHTVMLNTKWFTFLAKKRIFLFT